MKQQRALPENCEPFCVSHEEAAALWGVGTTLFDKLVEQRVVPRPIAIGGRRVWDMRSLKAAWRRFADENGTPEVNPWNRLPKPHAQATVTALRPRTP